MPVEPGYGVGDCLRAELVGGRADGVHHLVVIAVEVALELEDLATGR